MKTLTNQTSKKDTFLKWLPVLQWGLTFLIGTAVVFLGFRDTQIFHASELNRVSRDLSVLEKTVNERKNERDKQIDEMKKQIVTQDVFKAYMEPIRDEQKRQRELLERILEKSK